MESKTHIFLPVLFAESKLVNANDVPIPPTPQQLVAARHHIVREFDKPIVREMVLDAFDLLTAGCRPEEVPLRMKRRTSGSGDATTLAYAFCRDHLNGFRSFRKIAPQPKFTPSMLNAAMVQK